MLRNLTVSEMYFVSGGLDACEVVEQLKDQAGTAAALAAKAGWEDTFAFLTGMKMGLTVAQLGENCPVNLGGVNGSGLTEGQMAELSAQAESNVEHGGPM